MMRYCNTCNLPIVGGAGVVSALPHKASSLHVHHHLECYIKYDKVLMLTVREQIRQKMREVERGIIQRNDDLACWLAETIADIDTACWPDNAIKKDLVLSDIVIPKTDKEKGAD